MAGTFPAAAVIVPPGGMAVSPSGGNLALSFSSTLPDFYLLQVSGDLRNWTNCLPGIEGDGTVKTVILTNAISGGRGFYRLLTVTPTGLSLPQSTAFSILGYDCGGIKEQVSAGFSLTNGYPVGVVDLSTSCGGSGRGGGYQVTTYTASVAVEWDFAGNVISAVPMTNGVTVGGTMSTDQYGDVIINVGAVAYLFVPVPAAPTGVVAVQTNDQFEVSWTPNGVNPQAIISSTLTATPVNAAAAVLTATVTGPATSGGIPMLQPQTTYQVTVASTTIGGAGPASAPISVTTVPATVLPSASTNVTALWLNQNPTGSTDTLEADWAAANPGNSPVDEYQVTITGSDGGGTFTNTVSGTTLTTDFNIDYIPNWTVTVKAHNAAGWGPASNPVILGGL